MTGLQKILMQEFPEPRYSRKEEVISDFDLYNLRRIQEFMEAFIEKSVCDCDGRHIGFVSDIMISTWNNKPEYLVIDAKVKPWHLRNARFLYPLSSVTSLDNVKSAIRDKRVDVYENSAFDPEVVELQESFPLLSLKTIAEEHEEDRDMPVQTLSRSSADWTSVLW